MMVNFCFISNVLLCATFLLTGVNAGAYEDGYNEGRLQASDLWYDDYDENCNSIFDYSVSVKKQLLNNIYKASESDNWYDESFNLGGRDGARDEMLVHQEKCITPSECNELGETAAERVVASFCRSPGLGAGERQEQSPYIYCRKTSTNTCQGKIYETVKDYSSCYPIDDDVDNLTHQQSSDLQDDCEDMVDGMINWNDWNSNEGNASTTSDNSSATTKGSKKSEKVETDEKKKKKSKKSVRKN